MQSDLNPNPGNAGQQRIIIEANSLEQLWEANEMLGGPQPAQSLVTSHTVEELSWVRRAEAR